jgi:hypothetical protein
MQQSALFSYDPPRVLSVEPNHGPHTGGTSVIIRGANFGTTDSFPIATVGGVPCDATKWISDIAVRCVVPRGSGAQLLVQVTVCGCGEGAVNPQASSAHSQLFSYDEDIMRISGKALLSGINLKAHKLPLVLNRKQIVSEYEVSFVDPIRQKAHYFAVTPEMASVLPVDDYKHRFETCAIVGNSGSLVNSRLGAQIDEHDVVFRFHNAPTHRYENDVGSKMQFQVLDHYWMETLMSSEGGATDARWWSDDATLMLWSPYSQEAFVQLRQLYPTSSIVFLSHHLVTAATSAAKRMKARIEELMKSSFGSNKASLEQTSMFYAVAFAMQACGSVDVYGMDFRQSKYQYYDDVDPGDDERARNNLEYLMLLAMQSVGYLHRIAGHQTLVGKTEASLDLDSDKTSKPLDLVTCQARQCTNSCNKRGKSINGTCECDPVYAGRSQYGKLVQTYKNSH